MTAGGTGGETAARERVEAFLGTLARLGADDLMRTAFAGGDGGARGAARARAEAIAADAGLTTLLAEARTAVRERVLRTFDDAIYRPTMVGLNWGLSEGTTADRVATVRACEDAVTAAVVGPLADEATLSMLESQFELIDRGRAVDTAFDLTRATANAIESPRSGRWLVAGFVVVVAIFGGAAIIGGIWALVVAAAIGLGFLVAFARTRSRPGPD